MLYIYENYTVVPCLMHEAYEGFAARRHLFALPLSMSGICNLAEPIM